MQVNVLQAPEVIVDTPPSVGQNPSHNDEAPPSPQAANSTSGSELALELRPHSQHVNRAVLLAPLGGGADENESSLNSSNPEGTRESPNPDLLQSPDNEDFFSPKVLEAVSAFESIADRKPILAAWRLSAARVIMNPIFDKISSVLIICNCIFLAVSDPTAPDTATRNVVVKYAEYGFLSVFVTEMLVKVVVLGPLTERIGYFRDGWNMLDFTVILVGVTGVIVEAAEQGNASGLSALRAIRLLRPMRALTSIPEMKIIINSVIQGLPALGNVMLLYFFFIIMFGVLGVQLFKEKLENRCLRANETVPVIDMICSMTNEPDQGFQCPWNSTCRAWGNPDSGYTSFDNIGSAAFVIFISVTLEAWTTFMYYTMNASNGFASLYFIFMIMIGNLFIINLTLVIINYEFEKNVSVEKEKLKERANHLFVLGHNSSENTDGLTNIDRRESMDSNRPTTAPTILPPPPEQSVSEQNNNATTPRRGPPRESPPPPSATSAVPPPAPADFIVVDSRSENSDSHQNPSSGGPESAVFMQTVDSNTNSPLPSPRSAQENIVHPPTAPSRSTASLAQLRFIAQKRASMRQPSKANLKPKSAWKRFRSKAKSIMRNKVTMAVLSLCILANTIIMALEHYGQSDTLTAVIDTANFVFAIIFSVEIVCNLIAFWQKEFLADRFNIFDTIVVILGWIDIIFLENTKTGITVMRSFRLLRMFKVAKYFPMLQRWLDIIVSSVRGASLLTGLLALLIFIYALIGLQFFGINSLCKAYDDSGNCTDLPRHSFSTLGYSVLAVVQVLTGENWNEVMYDVMRVNGDASVVYFVSLFIFGTYLVLNLFISVLLNNRPPADDDADAAENAENALMSVPSNVNRRRRASNLGIATDAPYAVCGNLLTIRSDRSLFLIPFDNPIRVKLMNIVQHSAFEVVVVVLIVASCIILAIEDPFSAPDERIVYQLYVASSVISVLFALEACIKIIVYGFVIHKGSYLRDPWNMLDFVIAVFGIFSIILENPKLNVLKSFRALRPLRFINKSSGMKILVNALLSSMKPLGGVTSVCLLIFLVFAIMGVQFFKGSFYTCTTNTTFVTRSECERSGNVWETPIANFDNVPNSIMTLFIITTLEGWVDIMHNGMDAVGPDHAMSINVNPFVSIYFLVFVLIGGYFCMNFFLAVLLDNFDKENTKYRNEVHDEFKEGTLTQSQAEWLHIQRTMQRYTKHEAHEEKTESQLVVHRFISSTGFELFIGMVIVANVVVMCMEHAHQSDTWEMVGFCCDIIFISIYFCEAILKLIGFGIRAYFRMNWNRFDFLILIISLVSLVVGQTSSVDTGVATAFRILRLSRLLRVVKVAHHIRLLLNTLITSIPQMSNIVGLLGLVIFVYAIIGVNIFSHIARQGELTHVANFETFGTAFLILIRMTTGEAWNYVMESVMVQAPHCSDKLNECGVPTFAPWYFCSFTLIGMYMLMNLFIAIIVNSFNDTSEENDELVSPDYLEHIRTQWSRLDPNYNYMIPTTSLTTFIRYIGPPLGLSDACSKVDQWRFLTELGPYIGEVYEIGGVELPCGVIHYHDVLLALGQRALGVQELPSFSQAVVTSKWQRIFPEAYDEYTKRRPASQTFAAIKIQSSWKSLQAKRERSRLEAERRISMMANIHIPQQSNRGGSPKFDGQSPGSILQGSHDANGLSSDNMTSPGAK
eukprot:PhF_6_TR26709/c0_g1_i1/m.39046/K04853/CACNA1F; voltage-dependent calcium channel L type alpha-1F